MKRIKVVGLTSFSSLGISFYPGMEAEVDEKKAKNWIEAGLVKRANAQIEEAQLVEEPKELTPEEIERQNLEAMAKQLGIVDGLNTLSNEELENNIHDKITKKRDEREAKLKESQGQEDLAPTDKNVNLEPNTENQEPVLKKGKKTQSTAE